MKPPKAAITIALSLALVVPMAVAAQDPDQSLVLEDAAGDMHDLTTGEPLDGPAYFDLTGLDV